MRTVLVLALLASTASVGAADPPLLAARIAFVAGGVSRRGAAADGWTAAALNDPITAGDSLWTDRAARTELQIGPTTIGIAASTALSIHALDDHVVQLSLTAGSIAFGVRDASAGVEIDTPEVAVSVLRGGFYRVDVGADGGSTTVTVRRGEVEVAAGASTFSVHAGGAALVSGADVPSRHIRPAQAIDEFEDWVIYRDRRAADAASLRYVSPAIVGYEDLDDFGTWRASPTYGAVWVPHVRPDWTPYCFGHWSWIEPWGWTWVDDAAWGFAPFHYGRWTRLSDAWAWVPGAIAAPPVYAPALVAFVEAPASDGTAPAPSIAWFPLGPGDAYVPSYHAGAGYVRALNRPDVEASRPGADAFDANPYPNRVVRRAVTAVPIDVFAQSRSIAAVALRVTVAAARTAAVLGDAALVAEPARAEEPAAAAPPAAVAEREVIAREVPAPAGPPDRHAAAEEAARPAPFAVDPALPDRKEVVRPTAAAAPPASAEIAARQAMEQLDLERRHVRERAELLARHEKQDRQASSPRERAELRARHGRELADMDARHRQEHAEMQRRQEEERRGTNGG